LVLAIFEIAITFSCTLSFENKALDLGVSIIGRTIHVDDHVIHKPHKRPIESSQKILRAENISEERMHLLRSYGLWPFSIRPKECKKKSCIQHI
jgi:hypothetical protein